MSNAATVGMTGPAVERLNALVIEMAPLVERIRAVTAGWVYPFPHHRGEIDMQDFVTLELSGENDLFTRNFRTTEALLERLIGLYFRVVGKLCLIVEEVELRVDDIETALG